MAADAASSLPAQLTLTYGMLTGMLCTARRRRWAAAAVLVGIGWLASPEPVAVYDGIGQPDEAYRFVVRPPGAPITPKPTGALTTLRIAGGVTARAASVDTAENGPQASLNLPEGVLTAPGPTVSVTVTPLAPTDGPGKGRIDGNVYRVAISDPVGPVTLTPQVASPALYLRATTGRQPGPVVQTRSGPGQTWQVLNTSRAGSDIYVAFVKAAGEYALVFDSSAGQAAGGADAAPSAVGVKGLILVAGSFVVVAAAVLAVRWRVQRSPR